MMRHDWAPTGRAGVEVCKHCVSRRRVAYASSRGGAARIVLYRWSRLSGRTCITAPWTTNKPPCQVRQ